MSEKIILEEGSLSGLEFELKDQAEWTLGRDPELSSLVVEDPAISREQLLLQKTSEGILLKNLSESSPTLVNGEEAKEPILLKDGDRVKIGDQTFRFVENADVDESDVKEPDPFELIPTEDAEITTPLSSAEETLSSPVSVDTPVSEEEIHDSIFEEEKNASSFSNNGLADINFDLLDAGRYLLKVIGGPNNGAEFSIQSGESYIIGTDPNTCDIVFHDTSVSRQHARVIAGENEHVEIEDIKSRNGVLLDGKAITERTAIPPSSVITVGTTSFVIYDREGNMQTIISPLLPEIVKVLNKETKNDEAAPKTEQITYTPPPAPIKKEKPLGAFIAIAAITGLFVLMAIGMTSLFRSEPIQLVDTAHADKQLADAIAPFEPAVKYSFIKNTGRLLLVGHVLTQADKNQLLYNLQGMKFIKNQDDTGVVVDEGVWQSMNSILNRTKWKGITVQSPKAGVFVLTGYLQNRKQAEELYDYVSANFPYIDRLQRDLVIDEDVVQSVKSQLANAGINSVTPTFSDGILGLTGGVSANKQDAYLQLEDDFKKIKGVRQVRSQVSNVVTDQSTKNISDRYEVSGYSKQGNLINVIINGRIVTTGDTLDGMNIKSISPSTIVLEKDGVLFRIDYNR